MDSARERFGRGIAVSIPAARAALDLLFGKRKELRVKYGIDPTTPELHLGYFTVLRKLRLLQERGHAVVLLIGDFTARFGDPTEKCEAREFRSAEEVRSVGERYEKEIRRFLDRGELEVRRNSEWYGAMSAEDILRLMGEATAAQMLERKMFRERKRRGAAIALHELVYPVLQGYDSVVLRADATVVGQDQLFNENIGRILQERAGHAPQVIVGLDILPGTDGKDKMSQSIGNAIAMSASPDDQFGKLMAIPDGVTGKYAELLTDFDTLAVKRTMASAGVAARKQKAEVAEAIVAQIHGERAARLAAEAFEQRFSKREVPGDLRRYEVVEEKKNIIDLLVGLRLAKSRSDARRLVAQGGVTVSGKRILDPAHTVAFPKSREGLVLAVGKWRKPVRIVRATLGARGE